MRIKVAEKKDNKKIRDKIKKDGTRNNKGREMIKTQINKKKKKVKELHILIQ